MPGGGRPHCFTERHHHRHADGESDGKRGARADPIGYDAAKKLKGIKRNAAVDTQGNLIGLEVIAACVQDRDCAAGLLARARAQCPTLKHVFADGGHVSKALDEAMAEQKLTLEIIKRSDHAGFQVLPRR